MEKKRSYYCSENIYRNNCNTALQMNTKTMRAVYGTEIFSQRDWTTGKQNCPFELEYKHIMHWCIGLSNHLKEIGSQVSGTKSNTNECVYKAEKRMSYQPWKWGAWKFREVIGRDPEISAQRELLKTWIPPVTSYCGEGWIWLSCHGDIHELTLNSCLC